MTTTEQLPTDVVVAARSGDRKAISALVTDHLPLVYNFVGRMLGRHADVDDVVQETMLRAVRDLPALREPSRFRPWLLAIARHQVTERHRSRHTVVSRTAPFDEESQEPDPATDFAGVTVLRLDMSAQRRQTAEATLWLDEDHRETLALWWLEAAGTLTRAEVAESMGLSVAHAGVRIQRMREQLELARTIVVALAAPVRCPGLTGALAGWDDVPGALWRKRIARHLRECDVCGAAGKTLIPTERLLASAGLIAVPIDLKSRIAALGKTSGTPVSLSAGKLVAAGSAIVTLAVALLVFIDRDPQPAPPLVAAAPPSVTTPVAAAPAPSPSVTPKSGTITTTTVSLPVPFAYRIPGYSGKQHSRRTPFAIAPNGTAWLAWLAADGTTVHVTPLGKDLKRRGDDVVVPGREASGLVAHDDGFALLTRRADPNGNTFGDSAAYLLRYRDGRQAWASLLTDAGTSTPMLVGDLAWNGTVYGAYFAVRDESGHFGDRLAYRSAAGRPVAGGWGWGCSHNTGIALAAEKKPPFASVCANDWKDGLFLNTGIGFPRPGAARLAHAECVAGYCGEPFGGDGGGYGNLVRFSDGRYLLAWQSRGWSRATPDPADDYGYLVTARWKNHNVAVTALKDSDEPAVPLTADPSTPAIRYLTSTATVDHVNVRIGRLGRDAFAVWDQVAVSGCSAGVCDGRYTGTYGQVLTATGAPVGAARKLGVQVGGDLAPLADGSLAWPFVDRTPDYRSRGKASPTTKTITIAVMTD
ncbi:RNA polymerase sigma factor [Actinoplanes xinjiangensis]|uniref:RNA polymerase sigma factor n=1 Tax=Actinoplanes xinjiangensis TaxID=512350 RepID=UPI00341B4670